MMTGAASISPSVDTFINSFPSLFKTQKQFQKRETTPFYFLLLLLLLLLLVSRLHPVGTGSY